MEMPDATEIYNLAVAHKSDQKRLDRSVKTEKQRNRKQRVAALYP